MKTRLKIHPSQWGTISLVALVAGSMALSIFRIWGALPAVMGDEDIYSSYARFDNWHELFTGGYLYSLLFSSVEVCGPAFYQCAKGLNTILFVLGLMLLFVWARGLIGTHWSLLIVAVTLLSPLSLYTSVFMPETFFFSLISLSVFFLMHQVTVGASPGRSVLWTFASGLSLFLASLVKPHAVLMIPAFLFAWWYLLRRGHKGSHAVTVSASMALAILVIRGLVEGVFTKGQNFSPLSFYFRFDPLGQATTDSNDANLQRGTVSTDFSIIEMLINQMGLFTSVLVVGFASLVPLLLIAMNWRGTRLFGSGPVSTVSTISLLLLGNASAIAVLFNVYVTLQGDDHTDRVLFRYVEFTIPFLIVALLANLVKKDDSVDGFRPRGLAAIGLAMIVFAILMGLSGMTGELALSAADSMFATSLGESQTWLFVAIGGLAIGSLISAKRETSTTEAKVYAYVVILAISVIGVSGGNQFSNAHQPKYINGYEMGQYLLEEYKDDERQIVLHGDDPGALGTAKMLGRHQSISYQRVELGERVPDSDTPIVGVFDGIGFDVEGYSLTHVGSDFRVFEMTGLRRLETSEPIFPSGDVVSTTPKLVQASNFAFAPGRISKLELSRAILTGENLELCVALDEKIEFRTIAVQIGYQDLKQVSLPDDAVYCLEILYDFGEPTDFVQVASGFLEILSSDYSEGNLPQYGLEFYEVNIMR